MLTEKDVRRFWSKVDTTKHPKGCMEWIAGSGGDGYPQFTLKNKNRRASHVALLIKGDPVTPERPMALHSCDNPRCVNPDHLEPGTQKRNMQDRLERTGVYQFGSNHGSAVLDDEDVAQIRKLAAEMIEMDHPALPTILDMRKQGKSQAVIGEVLGIHQAHVSKILLGKLKRQKIKYTQYELAEMFGVTQSTISGILGGKRRSRTGPFEKEDTSIKRPKSQGFWKSKEYSQV